MPLVVRISGFSGVELPHPAQMHGVLRSSSCTNAHDELLRCWEQLAPPELHVSPAENGEICFVWRDVDPAEEWLRAVRDLIHRIPFRKSPNRGKWTVQSDEPATAGWYQYIPVADAGERVLRVTAPGFTSALEEARDTGNDAWQRLATEQHYRKVEPSKPARSGHGEIVPFRFPSGVTLAGTECGTAARRLRTAVLSRVHEPVPPEVSGHGANGKPHVAYAPLLNAGQPRSHGDVVGVAVVFPRDAGEWVHRVRSALVDGRRPLWLPTGSGRVELTPVTAEDPSFPHASSERWHGPAHTWASVTPMVLDRFSGKSKERDEIARSCVRLGLPEPSTVEVAWQSFMHGGARLRRSQLARRDTRPYSHIRVRFPVPVDGPILLGAQRHIGMGLCQPVAN